MKRDPWAVMRRLSQTLEQLEGVVWAEPEFQSSVVLNCHRYRKIPVGELTAEQLRLLISQQIALPFTVPLALQLLNENPTAHDDFFPGDIQKALAHISPEFWENEPEIFAAYQEICAE